jgi:hypothetical protein
LSCVYGRHDILKVRIVGTFPDWISYLCKFVKSQRLLYRLQMIP